MCESRKKPLVIARHMICYIAREGIDPHYGSQEVANKFDKTHATILSGCKSMKNLLETDPRKRLELVEIKAMIKRKKEGQKEPFHPEQIQEQQTIQEDPFYTKVVNQGKVGYKNKQGDIVLYTEEELRTIKQNKENKTDNINPTEEPFK